MTFLFRSGLSSISNSRRVSVRTDLEFVDQLGQDKKLFNIRKRRSITPESKRRRTISAVSRSSVRSGLEPRTTKTAMMRQRMAVEHKKTMEDANKPEGKRMKPMKPVYPSQPTAVSPEGGAGSIQWVKTDQNAGNPVSKVPIDKESLKLDFRGLHDDESFDRAYQADPIAHSSAETVPTGSSLGNAQSAAVRHPNQSQSQGVLLESTVRETGSMEQSSALSQKPEGHTSMEKSPTPKGSRRLASYTKQGPYNGESHSSDGYSGHGLKSGPPSTAGSSRSSKKLASYRRASKESGHGEMMTGEREKGRPSSLINGGDRPQVFHKAVNVPTPPVSAMRTLGQGVQEEKETKEASQAVDMAQSEAVQEHQGNQEDNGKTVEKSEGTAHDTMASVDKDDTHKMAHQPAGPDWNQTARSKSSESKSNSSHTKKQHDNHNAMEAAKVGSTVLHSVMDIAASRGQNHDQKQSPTDKRDYQAHHQTVPLETITVKQGSLKQRISRDHHQNGQSHQPADNNRTERSKSNEINTNSSHAKKQHNEHSAMNAAKVGSAVLHNVMNIAANTRKDHNQKQSPTDKMDYQAHDQKQQTNMDHHPNWHGNSATNRGKDHDQKQSPTEKQYSQAQNVPQELITDKQGSLNHQTNANHHQNGHDNSASGENGTVSKDSPLMTTEKLDTIKRYLEEQSTQDQKHAPVVEEAVRTSRANSNTKSDPLYYLAVVIEKITEEKRQLTELCSQLLQQMQITANKLIEIESRQEQSLVSLLPQHSIQQGRINQSNSSLHFETEQKSIQGNCKRCQMLEKLHNEKIEQLRSEYEEKLAEMEERVKQKPLELIDSSTQVTLDNDTNRNNRKEKNGSPHEGQQEEKSGRGNVPSGSNFSDRFDDLKDENESLKKQLETLEQRCEALAKLVKLS